MKSHIKAILSILFIFSLCFAGISEAKSVFVVDDSTGLITEYGIEDFTIRQTIQIPKDLLPLADSDQVRKRIYISDSGRILYDVYESRFSVEKVTRKIWYRDGVKEFRAELSKKIGA